MHICIQSYTYAGACMRVCACECVCVGSEIEVGIVTFGT